VIVQLAFNVEQTIVIETFRQLEVIGLSKLTVVLHHPPSQRPPQDQQWPRIAMESLQPTGAVVTLPVNAMSMKEIVIQIMIALELLYVEQTTVGQLDYLEVVGPVAQIAALHHPQELRLPDNVMVYQLLIGAVAQALLLVMLEEVTVIWTLTVQEV